MKTAVLIASLLFLSGCAFADHRWGSATYGSYSYYQKAPSFYAPVVRVTPVYVTRHPQRERCYTTYSHGRSSNFFSGSIHDRRGNISFGFSNDYRGHPRTVCTQSRPIRTVGYYEVQYQHNGRIKTTHINYHPGSRIRVRY